MAPSWGSFLVMLAPFSDQVGLGTVFESSYRRKSVFSRNSTFFNGFGPKMTLRWGQDRPKIAPRWVQDRLGSPFFRLELCFDFCSFWDRCWTVLGSQMEPRGGRLNCANRPVGGPRRSWDRLGSVLFSSCDSGSLFCPSWVPLRIVLGRLRPRFGSSWALLGSFWGTPCSILESSNPICPSTHQCINPSTRGSSAP